MSKEVSSDYKQALTSLKKNQIVDLVKKAREVLELNTTGKSKGKLVEDLLNLHGSDKRPNLFMGKPLLSFAKDSHIKIPTRAPKVDRKAEKVAKKEKAAQTEASLKKQKMELLEKSIKASEERVARMEAAQKSRALKILNLENQKKTGESQDRASKQKFGTLRELLADLKRRSKGASKAELAQIRKELAAARKAFGK